MQIKVLKYGQLSFTGHTIFVDRNKDVYNVATTLPRLPSQTTILLLQRKGKYGKTKTLKCRRDKVQKALEWLKNHSPAYADVVISNEILNSLPEDGYLGFPIIQGKSDTIHSAQGLSVGEEEFVKCLVLDSWESKWEKKWPGLFYVGASRACDKNSIYISPNLDKHSLRSIGTGKTWADQNKVCQEIEQKASQERATDITNGIGTEDDFKRLYAWFIANMLLKVSSWALGSRHDEEYDQRVKTKQIITDKLNAYKLEYINKFNETPTNINNVRRSGRRRRQTARYQ